MQFINEYLNVLVLLFQDIWAIISYVLFILTLLLSFYITYSIRFIKRELKRVISATNFNNEVNKKYREYLSDFRGEIQKSRIIYLEPFEEIDKKLESFLELILESRALSIDIRSNHLKRMIELENEIVKLKKINDRLRKKIN